MKFALVLALMATQSFAFVEVERSIESLCLNGPNPTMKEEVKALYVCEEDSFSQANNGHLVRSGVCVSKTALSDNYIVVNAKITKKIIKGKEEYSNQFTQSYFYGDEQDTYQIANDVNSLILKEMDEEHRPLLTLSIDKSAYNLDLEKRDGRTPSNKANKQNYKCRPLDR